MSTSLSMTSLRRSHEIEACSHAMRDGSPTDRKRERAVLLAFRRYKESSTFWAPLGRIRASPQAALWDLFQEHQDRSQDRIGEGCHQYMGAPSHQEPYPCALANGPPFYYLIQHFAKSLLCFAQLLGRGVLIDLWLASTFPPSPLRLLRLPVQNFRV